MTQLSLDPSSTCTGYAVMTGPDSLIDAGRLLPAKKNAPANERIESILKDLAALIKQYQPDRIIIEDTSGKVGKRHKGSGAGLAVHGKAIGAVWQTCRRYIDGVHCVCENEWTRGVPKLKRQMIVAATFKGYNATKDGGGDVSDAIGLGRWFFVTRPAAQAG